MHDPFARKTVCRISVLWENSRRLTTRNFFAANREINRPKRELREITAVLGMIQLFGGVKALCSESASPCSNCFISSRSGSPTSSSKFPRLLADANANANADKVTMRPWQFHGCRGALDVTCRHWIPDQRSRSTANSRLINVTIFEISVTAWLCSGSSAKLSCALA